MAAPTVTDNKQLIDKLTRDVKNLSIHKRKLPAKPPPIYKKSDGNFLNYSQSLNNYLKIMNVEEEERPKLLLTYLGLDDYEAVTRIYPADKLGSENYNAVAEKIASILEENISEAGSMAKLMSCKQNDMSMSKFLKKLESYANKAFPEVNLKEAREKCLMSAIQANCRSKVLAYEIYNFIKDKGPAYNEVALKCIELEAILGQSNDDYDANFEEKEKEISILQIRDNTNPPPKDNKPIDKKCFICDSTDHLKAFCPENRINKAPPRNMSNNYNSNSSRNFYRNTSYNRGNNYRSNSCPPHNRFNSINFTGRSNFNRNYSRPYFNKQNSRPYYQSQFSGPRNYNPQRRNWTQNRPVYNVQRQRPFFNNNFQRQNKSTSFHSNSGYNFNNKRRPINLINAENNTALNSDVSDNVVHQSNEKKADFFKWDQ